ncbi:MAG: hypothetical protein QOJ04_2217 [Caballeronia sp.]|nr:hypothetical protein [Caballeronia sp.]
MFTDRIREDSPRIVVYPDSVLLLSTSNILLESY